MRPRLLEQKGTPRPRQGGGLPSALKAGLPGPRSSVFHSALGPHTRTGGKGAVHGVPKVAGLQDAGEAEALALITWSLENLPGQPHSSPRAPHTAPHLHPSPGLRRHHVCLEMVSPALGDQA